MPLSSAELSYVVIQSVGASVDFDLGDQLNVEPDQYCLPNWDTSPSILYDFLDHTILSEESIMESMAIRDQDWEDMHHHSSFLPD